MIDIVPRFPRRVLLALAATAIAATPIYAHAEESTASWRVNYSDLNLSSAEGVRTLYSRIEAAANYACGTSNEDTDVIVRGGPSRCVRDAIGHAVHDLKSAALSKLFIETNGIAEARKFGISDEMRTASN